MSSLFGLCGISSVACGLVIFAATASNSVGQTNVPSAPASAPAPPNTASASDSARISIDVEVTDKSGRPIGGLDAGDFTLLDNKQPQKLVDFHAVDASSTQADPVSVLILVDTINNTIDTVAREREQLGEFLKLNNGELAHPTSIGFFADSGLKLAAGPTRDGNALFASLGGSQSELRAIGRAAGYWGDTERLQDSLKMLDQLFQSEAARPGRKLVLFISSGWPMLPWAGDQSNTKQRTQVFNIIVELTNQLRAADMVLYCLDPFDLGRTNPYFYQGYLKGVAKVNQAQYADLGLQVIAEHSGGQVIVNGNDIRAEIDAAIRQASTYYTLTFNAAPATGTTDYHALSVKTDKPGLTVRTTAGYYVQGSAP
ncbi:MAG: VWA domain-containing protein [Terracidiphilus sp.]